MPLIDSHGRSIEYLRISVTDRCDLRCAYCMPEHFRDYETPAHWLRFPEIVRLVSLFARLGLQRIRLTGGEPLLRAGLVDLVGQLSAIEGIRDISLSTNGTQLARHADKLRAAGLSRLNVSLDTLDPARFAAIVHRDALDDVLHGLEAANRAGFRGTKINMVWLPGTSRAELERMIAFCREQGFVLRLIENMPMGDGARSLGSSSLQALAGELRTRFGLVDGIVAGGGPARYLVSPEGDFSLGFITPLSQHFCATCNRVRLTVDGALHLCLGQENRLDLRSLLRAGASDDELEAALRLAIASKPEKHEFEERPLKLVRPMSKTGG